MSEQRTSDRVLKVVELMPGRWFETWHDPACVIFRTTDPWCDCGGYERTQAIKEVPCPTR